METADSHENRSDVPADVPRDPYCMQAWRRGDFAAVDRRLRRRARTAFWVCLPLLALALGYGAWQLLHDGRFHVGTGIAMVLLSIAGLREAAVTNRRADRLAEHARRQREAGDRASTG